MAPTEPPTDGKRLFDLSDRVAIVTGGAAGLGRQMAEGLGEMGASLVLCSRKKERCETAAEEFISRGIAALGLGCDVTDPGSVQETVDRVLQRFGVIHILVNNAGAAWGAPAEEMPLEACAK